MAHSGPRGHPGSLPPTSAEEISAPPCPEVPGTYVPKTQVPADLAKHSKFEILQLLGQGGMGAVYQARHKVMNRLVALKVINPRFVGNSEALERFQREVQAAAQLHHPNIIAAHDADCAGATHFLVMEYVEGTDLARCVQREGPFPVARACHFIRQAALGLQHAHEHGLVHRDIKPSNLMLTAGGVVKIMDFGLVRLEREGSDGIRLTTESALMGTADYIAPEQARDAHAADIRADIYSLGCSLYYLLAGKPPFTGASPIKKIMNHLSESVPLAALPASVPGELRAVLHKMLAKYPAQRYQTPAEVAQALAPFVQEGIRGERAWAPTDPGQERVRIEEERDRKNLLPPNPPPPAKREEAEHFRPSVSPSPGLRRWVAPATIGAALVVMLVTTVIAYLAILGRAPTEEQSPKATADGPRQVAPREETPPSGPASAAPNNEGTKEPNSPPTPSPTGKGERNRNDPAIPKETGSKESSIEPIPVDPKKPKEVKEPSPKPTTEDSEKPKPPDVLPPKLTNSLGMEFVLVPKGEFWMGGGGGEKGKEKVQIRKDFYLGVTTVTQGQWRAVMGNNPSWFSREGKGAKKVKTIADAELDEFPVETVSWNDVQQFLSKLKERQEERDREYRLPTSAEWEYACRGGAAFPDEDTFDFYLSKPSNDLSSEEANFNGNFPAGKAAKGTYLERPSKVASYAPNRLGLYDMHGNVWQWCADSAPGKDGLRLVRGGSWDSKAARPRAAGGATFRQDRGVNTIGFRLVLVPARAESR